VSATRPFRYGSLFDRTRRRLAAYDRLRRIAVRRVRDDTGREIGAAHVWIAPGGTRRSWP